MANVRQFRSRPAIDGQQKQPVIREPQQQPDDDSTGIEAALLRAAQRARVVARQHGTPLVIWRDGRVCEVDPNDLSEPCAESN
jgi:hypothetical protein